MELLTKLQNQFAKQISIEEVSPNLYRLYVPFFHSDGDMFSIYLTIEDNGNKIIFHDLGNTLMRISYTFNISSESKKRILSDIVKSNYGTLSNEGELIVESSPKNISQAFFQYTQLISKVSTIDILRNEVVRSLFYENLNTFMDNTFKRYDFKKNTTPIASDKQIKVDYEIPSRKPLYIFGVNDDFKASKVIIICFALQKQNVPFQSIVVHDNIESLNKFNRKQLTSAADKQFSTLNDFTNTGKTYIEHQLAI